MCYWMNAIMPYIRVYKSETSFELNRLELSLCGGAKNRRETIFVFIGDHTIRQVACRMV